MQSHTKFYKILQYTRSRKFGDLLDGRKYLLIYLDCKLNLKRGRCFEKIYGHRMKLKYRCLGYSEGCAILKKGPISVKKI